MPRKADRGGLDSSGRTGKRKQAGKKNVCEQVGSIHDVNLPLSGNGFADSVAIVCECAVSLGD